MMSPFLFGAGAFGLPSLLQSMLRAQAAQQTASLPPPSPSIDPDKAQQARLPSDSLGHFATFRQNMLQQLAQKKTMSRRNSSDSASEASGSGDSSLLLLSPSDAKDQAYWERRRKNNLAAKRSRDARRSKEDEIAIRAAFLEQENVQLKWELTRLKSETTRLRAMLLADSDPDCELLQN